MLAAEALINTDRCLADPPSAAPTPDVVTTEALVGRRLGAYTLERPRGQGGMGRAAYGLPGAAMAGSTASPRSSPRTCRAFRATAHVVLSGKAVRWPGSRTPTSRVSPTTMLPATVLPTTDSCTSCSSTLMARASIAGATNGSLIPMRDSRS